MNLSFSLCFSSTISDSLASFYVKDALGKLIYIFSKFATCCNASFSRASRLVAYCSYYCLSYFFRSWSFYFFCLTRLSTMQNLQKMWPPCGHAIGSTKRERHNSHWSNFFYESSNKMKLLVKSLLPTRCLMVPQSYRRERSP